MSTRFLFWVMKMFWNLVGRWSHTLWMLLNTLDGSLQKWLIYIRTCILNFKRCLGTDKVPRWTRLEKPPILQPSEACVLLLSYQVSEKCSPNASYPDWPGHLPLELLPIPLHIVWEAGFKEIHLSPWKESSWWLVLQSRHQVGVLYDHFLVNLCKYM